MAEKSEYEVLKERAKTLGIPTGAKSKEVLKEEIEAALNDDTPAPVEEATTEGLTKGERRAQARKEASKLVRIRVACMNPNKKEWEGELFTVGNSVVGSFKKFVPFNVEDGWHVPQIILTAMKQRKCQVFYTVKDERGNKVRKGKLINEFNIEVLPPLTEDELAELARKQAMANSID